MEYGAIPIKGPSRDDIKTLVTTPEGDDWRVEIVKELIQIRDRLLGSVRWTGEEIQETLTFLCTN